MKNGYRNGAAIYEKRCRFCRGKALNPVFLSKTANNNRCFLGRNIAVYENGYCTISFFIVGGLRKRTAYG
jgi:hypothetical protein